LAGAFLNSGDLLAEFQPQGRAWVGYLAAASVGLALFICVEALLKEPHWTLVIGVIGFALAEVSGQILHAALVRDDVTVMTQFMRWVMGYVSPSLVVVSGVAMAFLVHFGFPRECAETEERPVTRGDLSRLERAMEQVAQSAAPAVPLSDVLEAAKSLDHPESYLVDVNNRLLRRNGATVGGVKVGG
jgi:hypothetical protein